MRAGGVPALVQRMCDPYSHERVRVAAAGTLAFLMVDGAAAVEAARANALVRGGMGRVMPRRHAGDVWGFVIARGGLRGMLFLMMDGAAALKTHARTLR